MRRLPVPPLISSMFRDAKRPILLPASEEIDDTLVVGLGLVGDRVAQFEAKPGGEIDLLRVDACLLAKLPPCRLFPRLAGIEMTFGEIPSIRVLHQQKLPAWLTTKQENTSGLQGGYHFRFLAIGVS